jgi:hypothetical protein
MEAPFSGASLALPALRAQTSTWYDPGAIGSHAKLFFVLQV